MVECYAKQWAVSTLSRIHDGHRGLADTATIGATPMTRSVLSLGDRSTFCPVNFCGYRPISTAFPNSFPLVRITSLRANLHPLSIKYPTYMTKRNKHLGQIVLFPDAPGESGSAA